MRDFEIVMVVVTEKDFEDIESFKKEIKEKLLDIFSLVIFKKIEGLKE